MKLLIFILLLQGCAGFKNKHVKPDVRMYFEGLADGAHFGCIYLILDREVKHKEWSKKDEDVCKEVYYKAKKQGDLLL